MNKINTLTGADFIKEKIKNVSKKAGVYRMLDETGKVLYVGKAKNLKNRLTNYTRPKQLSYRIAQMVSKVHDLVVIETKNETDALLLENDLIKQFRPYYNVLLKDDKSYPFILITDEETPKILKYRGRRNIKGTYFGPFASATTVKQAISELQKIFGLRTCSDSNFKNRSRPCLLYQIKRCTGPCLQLIEKQDYLKKVEQAKAFLRGEDFGVQEDLKKRMMEAAERQEFELAAMLRDKMLALNHVQSIDSKFELKQTDIVAVYSKNGVISIQVFFYRSGKAEGNISHVFKDVDTTESEEIVAQFLMQFYASFPPPKQILLSCETPEGLEEALRQSTSQVVHINPFPSRGMKKDLTDQAMQNAIQAYNMALAEGVAKETVWNELKDLLEIETLDRVEIFDNSHIQGAYAVGCLVSANINGFQKNFYRRYNIDGSDAKTNDDFGMMKEVMKRRLKRGLKENDLPSAMLIDGGKGQLSSVLEIMENLGVHNVAVLAVAKGKERNAGKETLFLGTRPSDPIHLDLKSNLIHLIQRLRDEAHRFAIGSHRHKRSKSTFHETLLDIEGIGAKRKRDLMNHFGSARAIASASLEQIMRVNGISEKIAKKIYTFFHD